MLKGPLLVLLGIIMGGVAVGGVFSLVSNHSSMDGYSLTMMVIGLVVVGLVMGFAITLSAVFMRDASTPASSREPKSHIESLRDMKP